LLLNKKKVGRKTFAARVDLLEELSKLAKQRGMPLFTLVNEVFEAALEAMRGGS
jgi:predicted DNA-binding protein